MPKGLNDKQLDTFIKRLDKFEQSKGSATGTGLSISDYTQGRATDIPSLKKLIQDEYLSEMKTELGDNFEKMNSPVLFELLDYKFNTGRSTTDILAYANGDIDLDKLNGAGTNPLPEDVSSITLDKLYKAKDDAYKTTGGHTIDNPNPAYTASWSKRIGKTQENSKSLGDALLKVAGTDQGENETTAMLDSKKKEKPNLDEKAVRKIKGVNTIEEAIQKGAEETPKLDPTKAGDGKTILFGNEKNMADVTGDKQTKELAVRNNNPGNIRKLGNDTEFMKYPTLQDGYNALINQIKLYQTGDSKNTTGEETLGELMAIYAPATDNNDPVAYADSLAKKLGITPETKITDINTNKLALAISSVESPQAYQALIVDKNVDTGVALDTDGTPLFTAPLETRYTEMNKELDGGGFQTSYTTPSDEEKTITTNSPVRVKNIFGDTYLSEEIGDNSFKMKEDGSFSTWNRVSDKDMASKKLKELQEKSKKGSLTDEEFRFARRAYDVRQLELDDEMKAKEKTEGVFEDSLEGGVRNVKAIRSESRDLETIFDHEILFPEAKRRFEAANKAKAEELKSVRERAMDGSLSPEQQQQAGEDLTTYQKGYDTWREENDKVQSQFNAWDKEGLGGFEIKDLDANDSDFRALNDYLSSAPTATELESKSVPKPDLDTQLGGGDKKGGSSDQTITTPRLKDQDDNNVIDNPKDFTKKEIEKYSEFIDTDALQHQIDLDNTLLADLKSQKPIDDEVVEGDEDVLGNALGYGTDIARGIIGLSGATEKLPEYERGDAFNEYLGDARAFKAQGLTALEESVRKQRGERAYGFDVANIRNMGQGAGATLAAMGGAANRLQDRYAEVGLEDAAMKRQGRAEFARAALTDEQINRQQFEDKFKISMANKEAGAGLVRDAYTNLNERVAYNEAYGKGSQQYQYMNELTRSMKTNRELLKRGAENRKREGISSTEEAIRSNTDKRNKAIKARNVKK